MGSSFGKYTTVYYIEATKLAQPPSHHMQHKCTCDITSLCFVTIVLCNLAHEVERRNTYSLNISQTAFRSQPLVRVLRTVRLTTCPEPGDPRRSDFRKGMRGFLGTSYINIFVLLSSLVVLSPFSCGRHTYNDDIHDAEAGLNHICCKFHLSAIVRRAYIHRTWETLVAGFFDRGWNL